MTRNLNRRNERLVPILDPMVHQQVLNQIMVANLRHNMQRRDIKPDGGHVRVKPEKDRFDVHHFFMTNPSLSGRGPALHPNKIKDQLKKK
jgi:polyphosphate kinase